MQNVLEMVVYTWRKCFPRNSLNHSLTYMYLVRQSAVKCRNSQMTILMHACICKKKKTHCQSYVQPILVAKYIGLHYYMHMRMLLNNDSCACMNLFNIIKTSIIIILIHVLFPKVLYVYRKPFQRAFQKRS